MAVTGTDRLVLARWLRWVVPACLMAVAISYESIEHVLELVVNQSNYVFELLFFAALGPLGVFLALDYMQRILRRRVKAEVRTAALNRNLEGEIAERTAHLESARDELRRQAEELGALNEDLRRLDDLKSEFIALVSHELRRPLTNISGGIELISEDASSLPANSRRTLGVLASECDRLRGLVESILDVSRLEAGRLGLTCGPVSAEPLLRRCVASVCGSERTAEIVGRAPGGLPPVWADEVYLERVLRNVLTNAVKYSPPSEPIKVELVLDGEIVAIAVTNHGPSISAEDQRQLFSAFFRSAASDGTVPGYGLGLYFARKLIEAQGGQIEVASPVFDEPGGGGARFTVRLPVATGEA